MRRLHPPGPLERLTAQGAEDTPAGHEQWTIHAAPGGRVVLRVDAGESLWHGVMDEEGRPERVQVRVGEGAAAVDATFTFFDNEVLVWRRGAEPGSEAISIPQGCRVLWEPAGGRDMLAGNTPGPLLSITIGPAAQGRIMAELRVPAAPSEPE